MKKITTISLILILFTVTASAQIGSRNGIRKHRGVCGSGNNQITRPEKVQLRNDVIRLNMVQRNAKRDGVITPLEKVRIHIAKSKTRRDAFRFRHNGRSRVV